MFYILWASIVFQIVAAGLWFWSAFIKIPDNFRFPVTRSTIMQPLGSPLGGEYIGEANCPELKILSECLRKQGFLNRYAALFTAIGIALLAIHSIFHM